MSGIKKIFRWQKIIPTTRAMLKNKIKLCGEEAHGKGNSYKDYRERKTLRKFLKKSKPFQDFWNAYFGTPKNTILMDNPLGKYQVDLGIVEYDPEPTSWKQECKVHGLIEVDVFNEWKRETFPYPKFHVLERKLKYFQGTDHKYITCSFSSNRKLMVCTTRENIERCIEKDGVVDWWMPKIKEYDRVVRLPLDVNIFWFGIK